MFHFLFLFPDMQNVTCFMKQGFKLGTTIKEEKNQYHLIFFLQNKKIMLESATWWWPVGVLAWSTLDTKRKILFSSDEITLLNYRPCITVSHYIENKVREGSCALMASELFLKKKIKEIKQHWDENNVSLNSLIW